MHRTPNLTVCAADLDETASVTPADILRGAARYLELHGWLQNSHYDGPRDGQPFPPACADGAIGMAAFGGVTACPGRNGKHPQFRDYNKAFHYFNGFLQQSGWTPPCDPWCGPDGTCFCDNDTAEIVFAWNDADDRTAAEVIAALIAAANDYDRTHHLGEYADPTPVSDPLIDLLLDVGGYLPCGCHGSQREHTCGPLD